MGKGVPYLLGFLAVGLFVLIALSGCATDQPPAPQAAALPAVVTRLQCLPLTSYSLEQQKQAAAELRNLPQGSQLAGMIRDYGAMRSADRACLAVKP